MLREITANHQNNHRKIKRWFTDSNMDLFIWFKNQVPVCFQLSYNKRQQERSINWHIEAGFTHSLIRPKNCTAKYRIPATHSPEYAFDAMTVAREFLQASDHIDTALADFIFSRLIEYPGRPSIHSNRAPVSGKLQLEGTAVPAVFQQETTANPGIYQAP